ncbi:probable GTP-binding protein OBGM, mitochondrial isoform X1 [Euphorbia lathyris]|uniref:probable GTP-binding protein OBGM, mitochondrial isoform X1 n=1 Tax=Euphorbia lathyris TaxID=212925 RepID=UPI0033135900
MWMRCRKSYHHIYFLQKSAKSPWMFLSSFSCSDIPHPKSKSAPLQETRMKDKFVLNAKGGDGGSGCSSLRRSRHDRYGRADGGNGGRGGDVILECSPAIWDFSSLNHHINAAKGGNGGSKNIIGTRGKDKVIRVPIGTVVHLLKGELPSTVQICSATALEPWELPGTLLTDQLEPHQQAVLNNTCIQEEAESLDSTVASLNQDEGTSQELPSTQASQEESSMLLSDQLEPHQQSVSNNKCIQEEVESFDSTVASSNQDQGTSQELPNTRATQEESTDILQYSVAELTKPRQQIIIARGGEGGLGNLSFPTVAKRAKPGNKKDNTFDPALSFEDNSSPSIGSPGSEAIVVLELKSIADVGLVGMPNAGKSTLLGALSRAKPRVGHYAFTTLRPNLGKLKFDDFSITVADIPGLIKGAHENRGLGHAFLRHIERTRVLAYVVDLVAGLDGRKGIPPWEQLKDLVLELEYHQEGLSDKPSLVVANKIDEANAEQVYEELKRRVTGVPIYPVCAVLEEGVSELKSGLRMLMDSEGLQGLSLDEIDCSS